jgi:transposase
LVGMEATGGSRYWQREFKKLGHDARLMAPQFVKPFVKSDKNDANDAEAICEAVQRPNMRFVGEKTLEQQQIQMIHRVRSSLVANRTEICNEIRAILSDFDVIAPQGLGRLREKILETLSEYGGKVSELGKEVLQSLLRQWNFCNEELEKTNVHLKTVFEQHEVCRRLITIPGIGPITATAIVGSVPNVNSFKSGRHLSAWLGLVPKQNSSGGKSRLSGITKRGDKYLRALLVHGGRSVVRTAANKTDKRSLWIVNKAATRGKNKTAVAVANKNARVIWKILKTDQVYCVQ